MSQHYFVVKIDTDTDAAGIATALREALDSDNEYKHTKRAIIVNITNPDVTAQIDETDLCSTVWETLP